VVTVQSQLSGGGWPLAGPKKRREKEGKEVRRKGKRELTPSHDR